MSLKICLCCGQAMNGRQSANPNTCLSCDAVPSSSAANDLADALNAEEFGEPFLSRNAPALPHANLKAA